MNLGGTVHVNKTGCCLFVSAVFIFFLYVCSPRINPSEGVINEVNLRKLLAISIKAAQDGGKEVMATKNDLIIESKGKTKEGANDSVTTADYRSHCTMFHLLRQSFPTVSIISEESKTICNDNQKYSDFNVSDILEQRMKDEWVDERDVKIWIDPLDATQEYTEKLYGYVTTMVCVAIRGEPIIGVIHRPYFDETSWAWVGKGHSINLATLERRKESDKIKFIVSRSHTGAAKEVIRRKFKDRNIEITSAGGAGYKVLELINERADVYIHTTAIKKWDICAGNALLNELGGRMTTKYDTPIDYAKSDNPVNEEGLVATLKNHNLFIDKI